MQAQSVTLDFLKPVGTVVDLSDKFNVRVGDSMTPFNLFVTEGGKPKALNGLHPELEAAVGDGELKDGKVVMSDNAKGIHWVGNADNVTGYNRLTLTFPAEVFPQSGFCYGHLILANDAGVRESSVDIWFKVLDGLEIMGLAADYYDSAIELELKKLEEANSQAEQRLSEMNLQPEMYADLDAVRAAYPNGATKLIATDDGYLALYRNGQWIKGPIFLAAGIADNSISNAKLQTVNIDKLRANDIDFTNVKRFANGNVKVTGDYIIMSVDGGSGGAYIPIKLNNQIKREYVSFRIANVVDDGLTFKPQIYSVGDNYALGHQLYSYEYRKELTASFMLDNSANTDTAQFLFAIHGKGTVMIQVQANRYYDGFIDPTSFLKNVRFADRLKASNVISQKLWNTVTTGADKNLFYYTSNISRFEQKAETGNFGVEYLLEADIISENNYVNLCYRANGICDVYLMSSNKVMKIANLNADGAIHYLRYAVNDSVAEAYGLQDIEAVLVATHGQGSKFEIYELNYGKLNGYSLIARTINDITDQVGINDLTQIGSMDHLSDTLPYDNVNYVADNLTVNKDNQIIRQIRIRAKKKGIITFTTGTIDQNGLLVNATSYNENVNEGYSILSVHYPISAGQRLFLKWDSEIFDLYKTSEFNERVLLQDNTHRSTKVGYEGYSFYSVEGQVPFCYSYNDLTLKEQLANSQAQLVTANNEIAMLKQNKNSRNVIHDSAGIAYRLKITDGQLGIEPAAPKKVAIFGNSLTFNTGKIGMAASDQYHDWYYLTSQYLKKRNSGVTINDRLNVSTWEQAETSADRQAIFESRIKPQLNADVDLVVLQMGDNVNNDARKATLEDDAKTLLHSIKQISPNAKIYWMASWFGDPELISKIHNACLAEGATHIYINDLNVKENQSSVGATRTGLDGKSWQVVNPGAAAHPGDNGMKAIADRLIANFDF